MVLDPSYLIKKNPRFILKYVNLIVNRILTLALITYDNWRVCLMFQLTYFDAVAQLIFAVVHGRKCLWINPVEKRKKSIKIVYSDGDTQRCGKEFYWEAKMTKSDLSCSTNYFQANELTQCLQTLAHCAQTLIICELNTGDTSLH